MKTLNKSQLKEILNGATLLASGGGGSIVTGKSMVDAFPEDGRIKTASVKEAACAMNASGSLAVAVAVMGAPEAIGTLSYPSYCEDAVKAIQAHLPPGKAGKSIDYIVPIETGAISSVAACVLARAMDKTVVDGDGAGRAVPSLTNLTFDGAGISTDPTILCNTQGESIALFVKGGQNVEDLARPIISAPVYDEQAGIALWVMNGDELLSAVPVTGTLTLAMAVGSEVRIMNHDEDAWSAADPVAAVRKILKKHKIYSRVLFKGRLSGFETTTSGGFDHARITFSNISNPDETMMVQAQNESLIAWDSTLAEPVVMAPDAICWITEKGEVFSNADIHMKTMEHLVVTILGIEAAPALRDFKSVTLSFTDLLAGLGYGGRPVMLEA